jgi:hypothetical protein
LFPTSGYKNKPSKIPAWKQLASLFSDLQKEAIYSSETLVDFQGTIRRYITEDSTFYSHHCENLKSYKEFVGQLNSYSVLKKSCSMEQVYCRNVFNVNPRLRQTFLLIMAADVTRKAERGYGQWDPFEDGVTLTWRDVSVYTIVKENLGLCRRTKPTYKRIINDGM